MTVPTDRKYTESHEWFMLEGDVVTMGITQHAADELTDITFVELPAVGDVLSDGAVVGEVESVKATSEILTPIAGTVVDVNAALGDSPELVNNDAFGDGWMVKIKPDAPDALNALLDASEYGKLIS